MRDDQLLRLAAGNSYTLQEVNHESSKRLWCLTHSRVSSSSPLKLPELEVEGCNLLPELRERGYRKKAELHGAPRYETRSMPKGMK